MSITPNGPLAIDFAPNTQTIDMIRTTLESARPPAPALPAPAAGAQGGDALDSSAAANGDEQIRGQRRRPPGAAPRAAASNAPLDARRAPVTKAILGQTPTLIVCPDAASVLYLLPLLQPYGGMKTAFVMSGLDTFQAADALGARKASVILPAVINLEPLTRNRLNLPVILSKAGAKIALRPYEDTPEGYQTLRFQVAELVRMGLDRDLALKAITLSPAEMLGISDRVGSIDNGRDGNLILLDGDPLQPGTRVRTLLLEGKAVYEE